MNDFIRENINWATELTTIETHLYQNFDFLALDNGNWLTIFSSDLYISNSNSKISKSYFKNALPIPIPRYLFGFYCQAYSVCFKKKFWSLAIL